MLGPRRIRILFLLCILSTTSCKEELPPYDANNPILGKWQLISEGNWPSMESVSRNWFIEFVNGNILFGYDPGQKDTLWWQYTIKSDTLVLGTLPEKIGFEDSYLYFFSEEFQTLRLQWLGYGTFKTSIYKRSN